MHGEIPETDDEIIRCWCGVTGTHDDLFDTDGLAESCGGTGFVDCSCGGDQCVCHFHGQEVECPGCEDCDREEADGWYDDYDE